MALKKAQGETDRRQAADGKRAIYRSKSRRCCVACLTLLKIKSGKPAKGKKDESKVRQEMSIGGYALLRSALSARTRWSARRLMSR